MVEEVGLEKLLGKSIFLEAGTLLGAPGTATSSKHATRSHVTVAPKVTFTAKSQPLVSHHLAEAGTPFTGSIISI